MKAKISPSTFKQSYHQDKSSDIRVANSMETNVEKISTKNKEPFTRSSFAQVEDEVFGEMAVKMLAATEDSEEKYLLKLHTGQDIVQT